MENRPDKRLNTDGAGSPEIAAHLTAILNNAPGFIFSVDRSNRLIAFNDICKATAINVFGWDLKIGDDPLLYFEKIHPNVVAEWKAVNARAFAGEKVQLTKHFVTPFPSVWDISFNPITIDHQIIGVVCFGRDITEQSANLAKLAESEMRYRMVAENPVVGIAWGKVDGKLIHANQAFCNLVEAPLESIIGSTPMEITHPGDVEGALPYFKKLIRGEIGHYEIEKRYITFKGNIKWVKMNVTAVKDETGAIQQVIALVQDISDRKKAQQELMESETNMRHVLDNAAIGLVLLDRDFKILTCNKVAVDWVDEEMGINVVGGENFLSHFPEPYKQMAGPVLEAVLAGRPHQYEAKYTKRNKAVSWYHVRLAPIADKEGSVIGVCITAEDTTLRKNAETEIKLLNDSLERKVKERTIELEEANKELEAFTYSVSHDLLSPLRNIDSFIDILNEDYKNVLNAEGQQTMSVIKRNSTLMARLINDLLDFARIGKLPLTKQVVNMDSVVAEVMDELRFMTNKLAAKVKLNEMHPAYCDAKLIKQVWVNLLSNAVKYSAGKANPEIEIGSFEKNEEIIYYVKDNGVGFDEKYIDKLFGVFHRLHKAGEFDGTGVGLAIVHRIITKHGGRVWAEAKVNEGATFYFVLETVGKQIA